MKLIRELNDLSKAIKDNRDIGFVPTMGGLHKGHESLIKISKKKCNKTLVSIFVNPRQFNSNDDYIKYPRNFNKDLKILKKLKVNFVFLPTANQIYNFEKLKDFKLKKTEKILCAKFRKGHFEGVLDVMNRFIHLILPKYVFMGEKDFQQLILVKKYIEKHFKTKIISCKTIRDNNKIALSSRNYLLNKTDLNVVGQIAKELINVRSKIEHSRNKSSYFINLTKKNFTKNFNINIQYLETRNCLDLKKNISNKKFKLFIAYFINNIRLIDNF
jgi:pantoate--beta-alanine ligase